MIVCVCVCVRAAWRGELSVVLNPHARLGNALHLKAWREKKTCNVYIWKAQLNETHYITLHINDLWHMHPQWMWLNLFAILNTCVPKCMEYKILSWNTNDPARICAFVYLICENNFTKKKKTESRFNESEHCPATDIFRMHCWGKKIIFDSDDFKVDEFLYWCSNLKMAHLLS